MPERRPGIFSKRGLVALLKAMKPSREEFPEIHDPVSVPEQLKKSLRSKRATEYRVGTISEEDKY